MTRDEMAIAMGERCAVITCNECPLYPHLKDDENCYNGDADIERHYAIMFGGSESPDNVNHPSHYETGKFECIDVMIETQGVEAVKDFCICNAFKYLYRHNGKNGIEDIRKARWYIDKYLELEDSSQ